MAEPLEGAPWVFLLIPLLIAVAFVALPTTVVVSGLRASRRRRTWTPVQGVVTATRVEARGSGDSRRTVVVGPLRLPRSRRDRAQRQRLARLGRSRSRS